VFYFSGDTLTIATPIKGIDSGNYAKQVLSDFLLGAVVLRRVLAKGLG
jgi:hypothetical protein